jgi:ribosomal protein L11 methyltransferase
LISCPGQSESARDQSTAPRPYEELVIYYFEGRYQPAGQIVPNSFIGHWQEDDCCFLFFSGPAEDAVARIVKSQPQLVYVDRYCMSYIQWQGERVTTFREGKLRVIPPWEWSREISLCRSGVVDILLDPGVVFGTGTHPTTRDCLTALQLACSRRAPARVLDLGTGTGLLALAAARLGCSKILAVDSNLLAAQTAARNVRLNRLADRVLVVQGRAQDFVDLPEDLVLANIHYDVMAQLLQSSGFRSCREFILSGLLRSQAREVADTLAGLGATIYKRWDHEGIWFTFYGQLRPDVTGAS